MLGLPLLCIAHQFTPTKNIATLLVDIRLGVPLVGLVRPIFGVEVALDFRIPLCPSENAVAARFSCCVSVGLEVILDWKRWPAMNLVICSLVYETLVTHNASAGICL